MPERQFYLGLVITTVVALGLLAALKLVDPSITNWAFLLPLSAIFVLLTLLMYLIGKKAATDQNPFLFSKVFLGFTVAKVMFSAMLIVLFEKLNQSDNRWYLFGFLLVYIIFTIYETMVFMKLSQARRED